MVAYLVSAARLGDRAAADRLVRLVSPRLLAHAARLLGEVEQARDVVQSAWIDILSGLPSLRDVDAFQAFALRITSRKVSRLIGKRQRDRKIASESAPIAELTFPSEGETVADAASVRAALDRLPRDHKATIALFYLEEMSVAEVATALDVPIGTVKSRLMHAREKLRVLLEGDKA